MKVDKMSLLPSLSSIRSGWASFPPFLFTSPLSPCTWREGDSGIKWWRANVPSMWQQWWGWQGRLRPELSAVCGCCFEQPGRPPWRIRAELMRHQRLQTKAAQYQIKKQATHPQQKQFFDKWLKSHHPRMCRIFLHFYITMIHSLTRMLLQ